MAINYRDVIRNVFHSDEKEQEKSLRRTAELQNKTANVFGVNANQYSNPTTVSSPRVQTSARDAVNQSLQAAPATIQPKINPVVVPTKDQTSSTTTGQTTTTVKFDGNADANNLGKLDIITGVPKLTVKQIEAIIQKHYSKSKVISPSDAQAIYNAQNSSGISALVTLSIGALESGWGTSNIANKTHNLWGYGATNDNPEGNAHKYTSMEDAALRYSNSLKKDYYNGYGAKTIYAIGTGNNPAGKGYAYNNDGTISTTWYNSVNSIMGTLYNTAKSVQ